MKIKKTLFSTEIEISREEIRFISQDVVEMNVLGFHEWIKENFGLNLMKVTYNRKKTSS